MKSWRRISSQPKCGRGGLVTIYTVFVIELASRRVQILGSTPHPDEAFMGQVARTLTMADGNVCRVLICDRDAKWSEAVRVRLQNAGLRVIQTPLSGAECECVRRTLRALNQRGVSGSGDSPR